MRVSYLSILEDPFTFAILVDVIPPAEADEETAGDVFHRPKVHGQTNNDDHEYGDEARVEQG